MSTKLDLLGKMRSFLLANRQRFIESSELSFICEKESWKGILQRLVSYEGYDAVIIPPLDELGPHFVLLKTDLQQHWFSDRISRATRRSLSKRRDLSCKMCGRCSGDADPTTSGRRLRLFISPFVDPANWSDEPSKNVEVHCTACREGLHGLQIDRPSARKLKIQVRRARGEDQLELLNWLVEQYPEYTRQCLRKRRRENRDRQPGGAPQAFS